jgi:hypothetical protein
MAKEALPYTNAKLVASEVNVRHTLATRSEADIRNELEALQAKAALVDSQPFLTIEAQVDAQAELPLEPPSQASSVPDGVDTESTTRLRVE